MTCRYPDCDQPVAAEGMSRCHEHRMRWAAGKPVERPARKPQARPEWLKRSLAKDFTRSMA